MLASSWLALRLAAARAVDAVEYELEPCTEFVVDRGLREALRGDADVRIGRAIHGAVVLAECDRLVGSRTGRASAGSRDNYEIRCASCVRDFTSSLRNALRRWYSTVLGLMNS